MHDAPLDPDALLLAAEAYHVARSGGDPASLGTFRAMPLALRTRALAWVEAAIRAYEAAPSRPRPISND